MDWLLHNKEWVFSGIGVAAISVIFGWVFRRKSPSMSGDNIKQRQQGGAGSQNIQIGKIERKDK